MARFPPPDIAIALSDAAIAERVPLSLLWAVAFMESSFDASKLGKVTANGERATGLMQLMPSTIKTFGVANPLDAAQNARGGAKLLARLAKALSWDVPAMLAAYNWGPMAYARAKSAGTAIPGEVKRYVTRVLAAQHYYRNQVERPKGSLMSALNTAIQKLATDNPNHVPATQLASNWAAFYAARGGDSNLAAVTNPQVRVFWKAYDAVYQRVPLDLQAPDPSLLEPDFWARATKAVDRAVETVKEVGEQAVLGLGAGLFLLACVVFASQSGKRRS